MADKKIADEKVAVEDEDLEEYGEEQIGARPGQILEDQHLTLCSPSVAGLCTRMLGGELSRRRSQGRSSRSW